jgi:hypothetical protein
MSVEEEETYDYEGTDDFLGGIVICHYHSVDEVGCHAENDNEEDKLEDAGDKECSADGRGAVGWDLHDEESGGVVFGCLCDRFDVVGRVLRVND